MVQSTSPWFPNQLVQTSVVPEWPHGRRPMHTLIFTNISQDASKQHTLLQEVYIQTAHNNTPHGRMEDSQRNPAPFRIDLTLGHVTTTSTDVGVSKNNGTPKSSILIGFSIINYKPSILEYPYFWKHPCI